MKVGPLRLQLGADLRRVLEVWFAEQQEQAGCVISAVGSLQVAQLRFAGATGGTVIRGELEIISLSGTLSADGAYGTSALARWCAPQPSCRSRLNLSGDRPQDLEQIGQSLLAGLIRRQERRQRLQEGCGVQQDERMVMEAGSRRSGFSETCADHELLRNRCCRGSTSCLNSPANFTRVAKANRCPQNRQRAWHL